MTSGDKIGKRPISYICAKFTTTMAIMLVVVLGELRGFLLGIRVGILTEDDGGNIRNWIVKGGLIRRI